MVGKVEKQGSGSLNSCMNPKDQLGPGPMVSGFHEPV